MGACEPHTAERRNALPLRRKVEAHVDIRSLGARRRRELVLESAVANLTDSAEERLDVSLKGEAWHHDGLGGSMRWLAP